MTNAIPHRFTVAFIATMATIPFACTPSATSHEHVDSAPSSTATTTPTCSAHASQDSSVPTQPGKSAMKLSSSAFGNNSKIPSKYTCQGDDISPPLSWTGVPTGTKSFALIVDDPDAPDPKAPKMTWVHWVLYDIPPSTLNLSEDVKILPAGTQQGLNDWKKPRYGGPCPPIGEHRYFFKLYALDSTLPSPGHMDKAQLERAMKGHVLAQTQLVGLYAKK